MMASQFPPQGLEAFRIRMPSPPLPEEAAPDGNNSNIINNSRINNFQRILDRTPCFGGQCPVRSKRPLPSESSDAASKKRRLTKLPQGTDALEALRQRQCLIEQLQKRVSKAQQEGRMAANLPASTVARSFEKALFTAAKTLQEHLDVSTLDQRLELLVQKLQTRKKQPPSKTTKVPVATSSAFATSADNPNEAASLSSKGSSCGSSSGSTQVCSNSRNTAQAKSDSPHHTNQKADYMPSAKEVPQRPTLSRSESASTLASNSTTATGQDQLQHARLSGSDTSIPSLLSKSSVDQQKARVQHAQRQYADNLIKQAQFLKFSWANQTRCGMALPYKDKLPLPVKQFFFQTKLLTTPGWQLLPPSQIQVLIQQAEKHQEAYQLWAAANLPFFQCGEGQSCPLRPKQTPTAVLDAEPRDADHHSDAEDSFDSTI